MITKEELEQLISKLQSGKTKCFIDEKLNIFKTPLDAIKDGFTTNEFFNHITDHFSIEYDVEYKDGVFSVTIDSSKQNTDRLINECKDYGYLNKEHLIEYLDDDIADIQEITIQQAKALIQEDTL